MPGTTLNRLIFFELVKVFLMSLGTVTGLLVTVPLFQQANQMGLSLGQVIRSIPLFVPNMLPYTIPATTLFASCVVYGRLSHDNEVVAIKAAGVHLFNILKPALLLGMITTALTAGLYHTVIPLSQQLLFKQLLEDPEELLYNMLRRDRTLRHPNMPYVIYVKDVQGKRLIDVVLKKRAKVKDPKTGQEVFFGYDFTVRIREARLRVEPAEGKLYIDPDRSVFYDKNTSGETAGTGPYSMDLPDGLNGKDKVRISALTWDDLPVRLCLLREELDEVLARREANRKAGESAPHPDVRAATQKEERVFKFQVDTLERTIRNTEGEFYQRPALAVGCLLFALVGCPVGIWANRADYLSTFVICFLPAVFIYYPLQFAGGGLSRDGKVPLWFGYWMANIAIGFMALVLNWRLLRR
jgi:lipopolysaccharide export system permease protein